MKHLINWIDRFARIGVADVENSQKSARYAFNLLCLIGCLAAVLYTSLYLFVGLWPLALFAIPISAVGLLPFLASYSERLSSFAGIAICCVGFGVLSYMAGRDTLLHLYIVLALLNVVILRGRRAPLETAVFGVFASVVVAVCHYSFATPALGDAITPAFASNLATLNLLGLGMFLLGTMLTLTGQIRIIQDLLDAEFAKSEALLHNLLPDEIATRLKDRPGEVIADGLPAVTLLFADIVDFTPRSSQMTPDELVGFLNRIFSCFDVLTAERGLEKIKTIGDAYMVAAGLPVARDDHAEIIADMALAMQAEVARLSTELGEPVDLRIGIHSGPAIAGVIGTSKVFYDVWGDTVNTASRMESHGEPGRIQVTAATQVLLKNQFNFTKRGPVKIKGIGEIETYWLTGRC